MRRGPLSLFASLSFGARVTHVFDRRRRDVERAQPKVVVVDVVVLVAVTYMQFYHVAIAL